MDNAAVWIGCFTDDQGADGIIRLELTDPAQIDLRAPLESPGWFCPVPERNSNSGAQLVVAAQHLDESRLTLLRLVEPTATSPAQVERLDTITTNGSAACHVALDPSGRLAAVAHYTSGSVALVQVADGRLRLLDVLEFQGHSDGVPDRQDGPHAHQVTWLGPDQLLVCDLGADLVRRIQVSDDALVELDPIELPTGFGPRHLVLRQRPDGVRQFAVAGELSGQVATFTLDGTPEDGARDDCPGHEAGGWRPDGVFEATTRGQGVPSGIIIDTTQQGSEAQASHQRADRLLVAQRGVNTLAWLTWHTDGSLDGIGEVDLPGDHPRDLVLDESGDVLVAMQNSNQVLRLRPDQDGYRVTERVDITAPVALLPAASGRA